jgi:hypothetical protein
VERCLDVAWRERVNAGTVVFVMSHARAESIRWALLGCITGHVFRHRYMYRRDTHDGSPLRMHERNRMLRERNAPRKLTAIRRSHSDMPCPRYAPSSMPTFVNGEVEGTEIREICWQAASTSSCDIRCQRFPTRGKMRACCAANAFRVHLKGRPPGSANASAIQRTMPN